MLSSIKERKKETQRTDRKKREEKKREQEFFFKDKKKKKLRILRVEEPWLDVKGKERKKRCNTRKEGPEINQTNSEVQR